MMDAFVVILLIGGGLFSIAGGVLDWDWFMNNYRARLFVKMFGRNGARIVYMLLGIGLFIIGGMQLPALLAR